MDVSPKIMNRGNPVPESRSQGPWGRGDPAAPPSLRVSGAAAFYVLPVTYLISYPLSLESCQFCPFIEMLIFQKWPTNEEVLWVRSANHRLEMSLGSWDLGCFHPVGCSKPLSLLLQTFFPGVERDRQTMCVCLCVCVLGWGGGRGLVPGLPWIKNKRRCSSPLHKMV